jgi:hypothetical protein
MIRPAGITRPWVLRFQGYRLRFSVDARHNLGCPIDRSNELPHFAVNGKHLADGNAMRHGIVMPVSEHLAALKTLHPDEEPLAYTSHANTLANPGYVGFWKGELFHLAAEPIYAQPYLAIVSWQDGAVTVEDVAFGRELGQPGVLCLREGGMDSITRRINFAATAIPLVRNGARVPLEQMVGSIYDTRHVVNPLVLTINGVSLFVPNTQLQRGLLRMALVGTVRVHLEATVDEDVVLPLSSANWLRMAKEQPGGLEKTAVFLREHQMLKPDESLADIEVLLRVAGEVEQLLKSALDKAGYDVVDVARPLVEGEACFLNSHLEIHFRKALYPHNIFARWADGTCGFVVFPGLSGRTGTTLPYAQQFLTEELKVQDALLLDNGGDVRLWYRGRHLIESGQGRQEVRAMLVLSDATTGGVSSISIQ